ncbi:elongator complex protein 4 [Aspergillus brunneoviolaceus CBS 621.78]|uniref:PAXNEB-domain-containing protein n=1 Tax=Aspergillus brunneoviolaceus CBS 621.78 TaxID=1450534 RepID=A0ACD1G5F5_9EURO|nr:PAXNEB-domain-containing protein [Aspergillus brunneoviolaceus CBS 621.78]RAH44502.1 PAXNEB-domain-containing protein [Aspergillus brunneoviolaceus CBS 621.78]
MSFRKRNIGLSTGGDRTASVNASAGLQQATSTAAAAAAPETTPGVRPSPDDGRPTTSTGTPSLDNILAGHGGLPIGKTLLVEENGTTDFAGALLRYYAAEGVVQDHRVHVVGMPEQWGRSLPGLIGPADAVDDKQDKRKGERMKIAWRYERLGEFGAGIAGSRATSGDQSQPTADGSPDKRPAFCHAFDLTKRLTHPSITNLNYIPLTPSKEPLFTTIHKRLDAAIASSPPNTVHRIVIPSLLNPTIYPFESSQPDSVLPFLHSLRALLNTPGVRATAMITIPLSLFPRASGLVRWMELISDGVIELCPFPHSADALATSGAATSHEEPPQGMLKTHRLPVLHERGGGSDQNVGQDWAFTLSRRRFEIKPFSLPPAEGDKEGQDGAVSGNMPKKADLEF